MPHRLSETFQGTRIALGCHRTVEYSEDNEGFVRLGLFDRCIPRALIVVRATANEIARKTVIQ